MSQFVPNGYLIQDLNKPTNYIKTFKYFGINSYNNFPLSTINNKNCQELTDLQSIKTDADGCNQFLEFISEYEFLIKFSESGEVMIITAQVEEEYNEKKDSSIQNPNYNLDKLLEKEIIKV